MSLQGALLAENVGTMWADDAPYFSVGLLPVLLLALLATVEEDFAPTAPLAVSSCTHTHRN